MWTVKTKLYRKFKIEINIVKEVFKIVYSETNVGKKRENNEDYMLTYSPKDGVHLYLVLDGIGGASLGEVASNTAAEKVVEYFKEHFEQDSKIEETLKFAVKYANRCVYEKNQKNKTYKDMGTTISLLYLTETEGYHISIGDTRIYEILPDKIKQITEDDTYVNALVKDNIITKEEALTHPERHVLLRALGVTKSINFEVHKLDNILDKKFLICTDGLTSTSTDEEIFDCIKNSNKDKICTNLINLANNKGGIDNITVMYIEA